MAFCRTCNGYVVGGGICSKCRIPVSDWNRNEIGLFKFLAIGFAIFLFFGAILDWFYSSRDDKGKLREQKAIITPMTGEVSENGIVVTSPQQAAQSSALGLESDETNPINHNNPVEVARPVSEATSLDAQNAVRGIGDRPTDSVPTEDQFDRVAKLVDPRGLITIQSKPSIMSKNVDKLPADTEVHVADTSGKWVKVRLSDGRIGFVRQRQLIAE